MNTELIKEYPNFTYQATPHSRVIQNNHDSQIQPLIRYCMHNNNIQEQGHRVQNPIRKGLF